MFADLHEAKMQDPEDMVVSERVPVEARYWRFDTTLIYVLLTDSDMFTR